MLPPVYFSTHIQRTSSLGDKIAHPLVNRWAIFPQFLSSAHQHPPPLRKIRYLVDSPIRIKASLFPPLILLFLLRFPVHVFTLDNSPLLPAGQITNMFTNSVVFLVQQVRVLQHNLLIGSIQSKMNSDALLNIPGQK